MDTATNNNLTGTFKDIFQYAAFSAANAQRNYKRNGIPGPCANTFMEDLSIAEYIEQGAPNALEKFAGVEETICRATNEWKHSPEMIIALLFAVNSKSFEHWSLTNDKYKTLRAFRLEAHNDYAEFYSERYYSLVRYVLDEMYAGEEYDEIREEIFDAID